jgi:hypothetical protein
LIVDNTPTLYLNEREELYRCTPYKRSNLSRCVQGTDSSLELKENSLIVSDVSLLAPAEDFRKVRVGMRERERERKREREREREKERERGRERERDREIEREGWRER